jgi:hypothetical protein
VRDSHEVDIGRHLDASVAFVEEAVQVSFVNNVNGEVFAQS